MKEIAFGQDPRRKKETKIQPFPLPVIQRKQSPIVLTLRFDAPVSLRVPPGQARPGFVITGGGSTPGLSLSFSFDNNNFVVFAPLSRSLRFGNGDDFFFSQPQYLFSNIPKIIRGRGLGGGGDSQKDAFFWGGGIYLPSHPPNIVLINISWFPAVF